jgi:hypothetical protein
VNLVPGVARVLVVQSEDPVGSDGAELVGREAALEPGPPVHRIRSGFGARQASQRDVIAALTVSHRAHVQLGSADAGFVVEPELMVRPAAPTGLREWQAWHRVSPWGLTVSHSGHAHVSATAVTFERGRRESSPRRYRLRRRKVSAEAGSKEPRNSATRPFPGPLRPRP